MRGREQPLSTRKEISCTQTAQTLILINQPKSQPSREQAHFQWLKMLGPQHTNSKFSKFSKCGKAVINESNLKSYHCPTFAQQQKEVLANSYYPKWRRCYTRSRKSPELQKLIKWQGQPFEESAWEDRCKIIKEASQLCQDFHKNHSDAPRVPTIQIPGRSYSEVAKTRP